MPRFDKWLTGVAGDEPVDRVARAALETRLAAVRHFLVKAAVRHPEAEDVHQLRIWTRRSAAALRLFTPALPKSPKKWMKKTLKKLRRLAGAVRDCDVYLKRLETAGARPPKSVLKGLRKERRAAGKQLQARRRHLQRKDRFDKQVETLLAGIAWPKRHSSRDAPPFAYWCRYQIAPLGERLLALAALDLAPDRRLHEFRLAAKRLRYALELAGPAISQRPQQGLYDELSILQDRLGEVCDHLSAAERLRGWLEESKSAADQHTLNGLLKDEEKSLTGCRRRFLRWWSRARCARLQDTWEAAMGTARPKK
jgi:CHAD domain-containing protein